MATIFGLLVSGGASATYDVVSWNKILKDSPEGLLKSTATTPSSFTLFLHFPKILKGKNK